jgi:uncharacterized protein (DUF2225 family)
MDFDQYEVAVCSNCFFAACRLDQFIISLPEGKLPSVLNSDQKDLIVKKAHLRGPIVADYQKAVDKYFFSMPRDRSAACLSWELYDKTVRDIAHDKTTIDALEVARANLMVAKFTLNDAYRKKSLTTAHVWLTDILGNTQYYSDTDLVMANLYLISINLALDKVKDAQFTYTHFMQQFQNMPHFRFWIDRARSLMEEE